MPVVLTGIALVMYLLIFQYDRCLLEQDTGVLALRGSAIQVEDSRERIRLLEQQAVQQNEQKYLMYDGGEAVMRLEKGVLTVEREGCVLGKNRKIKAVYSHHVLSPVTFVRQYHKFIHKKEKES